MEKRILPISTFYVTLNNKHLVDWYFGHKQLGDSLVHIVLHNSQSGAVFLTKFFRQKKMSIHVCYRDDKSFLFAPLWALMSPCFYSHCDVVGWLNQSFILIVHSIHLKLHGECKISAILFKLEASCHKSVHYHEGQQSNHRFRDQREKLFR